MKLIINSKFEEFDRVSIPGVEGTGTVTGLKISNWWPSMEYTAYVIRVTVRWDELKRDGSELVIEYYEDELKLENRPK